MAPESQGPLSLYDADGSVDPNVLTDDARAVLDDCVTWLASIGRSMFLPIDLIVVLVRRGHPALRRALARAARGTDDFDDIEDQLTALARRVDRHAARAPALHISQFSLGFIGILEDALTWAREAGRTRISEADIGRVVRWRAELQESASVRWAIRQLSQPGGENLFDTDGTLRASAFVPEMWGTMLAAMQLSAQAGMPFLGTPYLIAAMCTTREGPLWRAAESGGVDPRRLRDELLRIVGSRSPAHKDFTLSRRTLTPRLVRMIVSAAEIAERAGHPVTDRETIEAFLDDGGSSLELVRTLGLEFRLRELLGETAPREPARAREAEVRREPHGLMALRDIGAGGIAAGTPTLDLIGRDLTAEARAGRLPEIIGRDDELQRVINVLLRTEQRNPLLTGEAGVGKTALAVALASRIARGRVPRKLAGMRVIEINGASLVGGTSYRGELEQRIKAMLAEAEHDVVLFIDEAHAVFAPRSGSGQPAEVPNHLKAALASGQIAVVAATTESEYQRWIEQDPALKRRFERIEIPELSPVVTRQILVGLAPRFESDYDVPVSPDAIDAAIDLSARFMPEQSLPDKAKKLLMDAVIAVSSELALEPRQSGQTPPDVAGTPNKRVVSRIDVARQVALKTGAPLDRVIAGAVGWWVGLRERLQARVVGQDEAVERVAHSLVAGRLNAAGRRRPQGVFLFAGPPGVGKSQLATALAEEIFGSRKALLRLEMSDFQESHSVSRLIGSPPGYVGYQDEDALVTPLRRRPSSVVLLKGFSLAHPRVQERLIRLLDEGEITDTRGLRADASHAIFVLTLDVELHGRGGIGFGADRSGVASQAPSLKQLDPELHERMRGYPWELVLFRSVSDADNSLALQLFESRLDQFRRSLRDEYGLELSVETDVLDAAHRRVRTLVDVREVEQVFREAIVEPASAELLKGVDSGVIVIARRQTEPA